MRLFSNHPRSTGGETGLPSAPAGGAQDRRAALRLRLALYCERHIRSGAVAAPGRLDRRFTAFFTAARHGGYIDGTCDPRTLAHLFVALLAGLDLRRAGGTPPHDLRRMAVEMIRTIVA